jgi:hypothetical protein
VGWHVSSFLHPQTPSRQYEKLRQAYRKNKLLGLSRSWDGSIASLPTD